MDGCGPDDVGQEELKRAKTWREVRAELSRGVNSKWSGASTRTAVNRLALQFQYNAYLPQKLPCMERSAERVHAATETFSRREVVPAFALSAAVRCWKGRCLISGRSRLLSANCHGIKTQGPKDQRPAPPRESGGP